MKVRFGVSVLSGTAFPHRRDPCRSPPRQVGQAKHSPRFARPPAFNLLLFRNYPVTLINNPGRAVLTRGPRQAALTGTIHTG